MTDIKHLPIPEMLGRRDAEHGAWSVDSCAPVRGLPHTNIVDRKMVVPVSPEETDRVIRAHEMVHAKVSPAEDFALWIARGIATETALRSVEELRVNYLVKKAGFDPMKHLADGSELVSGQRMAEAGDWTGCVYTAVGFAGCAGGKDFLTGVRRVNRAWGETLREIVKKAEKEIAKADKRRTLTSTARDPRTGLAPLGFGDVERIAELIDRLANPPKPENEDGDEGQAGKDSNKTEAGDDAGKAVKGADKGNPTSPVNKDDVKNMNPTTPSSRGGVPQWGELKVAKLPLTRHAPGGLGRKRRASDIGRNPRRIGNALSDPQKRIFDSRKKGNGGVVIIDGSGSMAISTEDIVKIVDSAHGATVAVYSADMENKRDNFLILAEKGKMVQELPHRNGGNGVDAPALKWGISKKQHASAPILFVTDGAVHGLGTGYEDILAIDCINLVLKHKVVVCKDVTSAVKALNDIKAGRKPERWFPYCWKRTWKNLNGTELR